MLNAEVGVTSTMDGNVWKLPPILKTNCVPECHIVEGYAKFFQSSEWYANWRRLSLGLGPWFAAGGLGVFLLGR